MGRSIKSIFPSLLIIHASLPMYISMSYLKKNPSDFLHPSHLSDLFTANVTHTHIYTIFTTKNSIPLSHFSMPNYLQYL